MVVLKSRAFVQLLGVNFNNIDQYNEKIDVIIVIVDAVSLCSNVISWNNETNFFDETNF